MKRQHFALLAALWVAPGCATKPAPAPEPAPVKAETAAAPQVVPIGPVVEMPEVKPAPEVVTPELPQDMKVVVNSKAGAKTLTLVHRGHIVSLQRPDTTMLGDNSVSLPFKETSAIAWESSDRQTFETLRGVVEWETQPGKKETPKLRAVSRVLPMRALSAGKHDCRAFDGTNEVITILCRVDSLAVGASRAFGGKAHEGIAIAETGEKRYFRMDLDPSKNEFDAVVIGYSDGVRGHVIRAEASKLPGETKASLALLSTARAQPIRIIRRFHHHPHHEFFDML